MKSQIISFLQKEIDNRVTPGAVIRIKHKGEWIVDEALGSNSLEYDKVPMTAEHLFDVASLTKVMATLPAMLQLFQTGDIYLHDKVARFLPTFAQNDKGNITLQQLLTHSSGLIAHRPYFEKKLTYDEVLAHIYKENLVYTPETKVVYSDLGFILLGAIIEKVTDQSLQDYVKNNIFKTLQMSDTTYLPSVERHQYAPTEYLPHLQDFKYGIVHDDNTEFMGGISGHAGLFSTIGDIAKFCDMLECNGEHDGKQFLHPLWIQKSRENFTSFSSEARGIGWQLNGNGTSPIGDLMSNQTYGHTGFTGTSFYIDPKNELIIILLTNRVYFGRHDEMVRLRPRLHNLIMTNLTS